MENLFNIESGVAEDFSYALGRRKAAKAKGLKPLSKAFRKDVKAQRKTDKSQKLSRPAKKVLKKQRKGALNEAIATGKVKKNVLGKVLGGVKKVGFAPMRNATLALIRLNLWGIATKIAKLQTLSPTVPAAKTVWIKILSHWIKFGGDKNSLLKAIKAGKVKKQLLTRKSKQVANPDAKKKKIKHKFEGFDGEIFDGDFDREFSNVFGADDVFYLIGSAATVFTTIVSAVNKNKGLVGEMPLSDADKAALAKNPPASELTTADIAAGAEEAGKSEIESKKILGRNIVIVIGGILLLGAILWMAKGKKSKAKSK